MADAGTPVDGGDESQKGQHGAIPENRMGLAGLGPAWVERGNEQGGIMKEVGTFSESTATAGMCQL